MISLTTEEKVHYNKQKVCYICKKEFDDNDNNKKQQKVRGHCHYTGKYRGAAHNCYGNLQIIYLKESITINALIVNLILIILKFKKMEN